MTDLGLTQTTSSELFCENVKVTNLTQNGLRYIAVKEKTWMQNVRQIIQLFPNLYIDKSTLIAGAQAAVEEA